MRASGTMAIGWVLVLAWWAGGEEEAAAVERTSRGAKLVVGKELFQREWVVDDPRSHGGDGLGPVYNGSSCLACHNQGGVGGGGSSENNVEILTPIALTGPGQETLSLQEFARRVKNTTGFTTLGSVILHKFGTDPGYPTWRASDRVQGRNASGFRMRSSSRNTPAVFGAGLIDTIPNHVIEAQVQGRGVREFPEILGRVGRTPSGELGRFGWKAQTASLEDFVLTACSVELGLEVPDHGQSADPLAPDRKAPGPDLTRDECNALVAYVASLPAPGHRAPFNQTQAETIVAGEATFRSIGCAACHTPNLGHVEGLYGDLILHDMGGSLSDAATYYGSPTSPADLIVDAESASSTNGRRGSPPRLADELPAGPQEWRTPPLWGIRDSAPYLHDGRAANLNDAILAHGGESDATTLRYSRLSKAERSQLTVFLMSLTAPRVVVQHHAGTPRRQ
ncbi:di-heme oxidoredictase family protein [Singulisphaera rosea]